MVVDMSNVTCSGVNEKSLHGCPAPPPPYASSPKTHRNGMKYSADRNDINCLNNVNRYANRHDQMTNRSVVNHLASYGVYHEVDDDDGFLPNSTGGGNGGYPEVVVNAAGRTTVVPSSQDEEAAARDCGCFAGGAERGASGGWGECCKPSVLLLILVILIIIFLFVSGALIYINYVAHRPRHGYAEEPCEKTFCAWGAQCATGADGRAHCQCPTHCRPHAEPVCGSDGRTYDNHCQLRVASCRARVNTKISYLGKCETRNPCKTKQCPGGSECVSLSEGRNATCRCLDQCAPQSAAPVCGTDGVDYANECELQATACRTKHEISIKFKGKCDPCQGVTCATPEICQLDDHRNPVCRCGDACALEFNPVCASDGKTYSNECVLRQEGCRSRKTLHIIYRGKCSSGVNPCAGVDCAPLEECTINKFGIARCECPPKCEPIVRPVCAEDGRTHASECEAKMAACLARSQRGANILHAGVCGSGAACSQHKCRYGASCEIKDNAPYCVCPAECPAAFDPVCGTDGTSYGNECKLKREGCLKQKDVAVLYKGPCDGCENKQCDFYAICNESDEVAHCACPKPDQCVGFNGTVCGTDGATYPNECALRVASCNLKQLILVAHKGDCDLCSKDCKEEGAEAVCATDGVTYANECELRRAACRSGDDNLEVVFYGDCGERFSVAATQAPSVGTSSSISENNLSQEGGFDEGLGEICRDVRCDYDATCEPGPDNFPKCVCKFNCSSEMDLGDADLGSGSGPVCASDLRIYASSCDMKMAACEKQMELRLRPLDLCQGMEVKPCNGDKPIADPLTGSELNCGNGPSRQDCPSGSYCHQTISFSRCCKKDQNPSGSNCEDSWYGCCPDGKTPALGTNHTGCPVYCGCNKLGSYSESCDPTTLTCNCRPGVGGEKCDRCEPGYWGLPKISSGHHGCIPCGCSISGSVRDDCEQMTGRCVCKPGIQGQKCTTCTSRDKVLGPNGCVPPDQITGTEWPLRRYTPLEFTQSDDSNSPLSKSTRHLLVPEYKRKDQANKLPHNIPARGFSSTLGALSVNPTSATVNPLLGDLCSSKTDCPINRSDCRSSSCVCLEGYLESPDRQECVTVNPSYGTPGFTGRSYIRLKPLSAYHKLSIELEFKTLSFDAILLYAQQNENLPTGGSDAGRDFVSLAIRNGHVEFRYDLGDGPVVISSLEKVILGKTHRVVAKRYHRDGMLQLDDGENVAGQSGGTLRALDISGDTFLGYVPVTASQGSDKSNSKVFRNIGTGEGLRGCVLKLRIGRKDVSLSEDSEEVVRVKDVEECGTKHNHKEKGKEEEEEGEEEKGREFHGRNYIRLPPPINFAHQFTIELTIKTRASDGLILYCAQSKSGGVGSKGPRGDFLSLAILRNRVQFRYNLGSGIANLTSETKIAPNTWHKIKITRTGRDGTLAFDSQPAIKGRSGAALSELNLGTPLYIGAVKNYKEVHPLAGITKGFKGQIGYVNINGKPAPVAKHLPTCTNDLRSPCVHDLDT